MYLNTSQHRNTVKTIAIFRALKLGDLMCTVPALRALRRQYPKATIILIGLPWAEAFVKRYSNYLDDFVKFPGFPGLPEQKVRLSEVIAFIKLMKERQFDLLIQMHGKGTITNSLLRACNAKRLVGFVPDQKQENENFLFYPEQDHEIHKHRKLLAHLGIVSNDSALTFPLTESDYEAFTQLQQNNTFRMPYIVIHPGSISGKKYPAKKFAAIADSLYQAGYSIIFTGTAGECDLTEKIMSEMVHPAVSVAGKTDLGTLGVLLQQAVFYIGNDTGVSHIATAVGVPSIVIFTTADPTIWAPLDTTRHKAVLAASVKNPQHIVELALTMLGTQVKERSIQL